jgi:hypothetical protein
MRAIWSVRPWKSRSPILAIAESLDRLSMLAPVDAAEVHQRGVRLDDVEVQLAHGAGADHDADRFQRALHRVDR